MNTPTKLEPPIEVENLLGIKFKNRKLLTNAFIHRSYLNEHKDLKELPNERLEFLGDSVLSLTVSKFLYLTLPKSPEGELTQIRASLVRTETLAKVAGELLLGKYLFLSKGEEESAGRLNKTILANTFEALLGAIFLDLGPFTAQKIIKKLILNNWQSLSESAVMDNKSKLQEVLQRQHHLSPAYKLIKTWGPDHQRQFEVGVFLEENILGSGVGKNKQSAAQNAAGNALSRLKK